MRENSKNVRKKESKCKKTRENGKIRNKENNDEVKQ